jgi:hypothetical protein
MSDKVGKESQERLKKVTRETEQVLQEAKIIARWVEKPFYIS